MFWPRAGLRKEPFQSFSALSLAGASARDANMKVCAPKLKHSRTVSNFFPGCPSIEHARVKFLKLSIQPIPFLRLHLKACHCLDLKSLKTSKLKSDPYNLLDIADNMGLYSENLVFSIAGLANTNTEKYVENVQ